MKDLASKEEQKLAKMLRSPVSWEEFYLHNRDGSPRRYWEHQTRRPGKRGKKYNPPRRQGFG